MSTFCESSAWANCRAVRRRQVEPGASCVTDATINHPTTSGRQWWLKSEVRGSPAVRPAWARPSSPHSRGGQKHLASVQLIKTECVKSHRLYLGQKRYVEVRMYLCST